MTRTDSPSPMRAVLTALEARSRVTRASFVAPFLFMSLLAGCSLTGGVHPPVTGTIAIAHPSFDGPTFPPPEFIFTLPGSNEVGLLDAATGEIKDYFAIKNGEPTSVIANPVRPLAYIAVGNVLDVYETNINKTVKTISNPGGPVPLLITSNGNKIYTGGSDVEVFSTLSDTLIASIPVTWGDAAALGGVNQSKLFVAQGHINRIAVIDTATDQLRHEIFGGICLHDGRNTSCDAHSVVTSPDGAYLLTAGESNTIVVFDAKTDRLVDKVAIPNRRGDAEFIGVNPVTAQAFFTLTGCCHQNFDAIETEPPFDIQIVRFNRERFVGAVGAFSPSGEGFAINDVPAGLLSLGTPAFGLVRTGQTAASVTFAP